MISTKKNPNFPSWIQIFAFGELIEEVEGRAKAVRLATKIAKEHKQTHVNHMGQMMKID